MGRSNSELQKQRVVSPAVVQGEGNNDNYILSLGTETVVCCRYYDTADEVPAAFAELPVPKQVCRSTAERSAAPRIGNANLDIYPNCDTEQMKTLAELLRLC